MKKEVLLSCLLAAVLIGASAAGADPENRKPREQASIQLNSYRSPSSLHKVVVASDDQESMTLARTSGAIELADYGSFRLFSLQEESLQVLQSRTETPGGVNVRDDFNLLLLRWRAIDTTVEPAVTSGLKADRARASAKLRLVHFVGPVKGEWLDQLTQSGLEPVAYIPSNGYLVHGDNAELRIEQAILGSRRPGRSSFIQWHGPYLNEYKIDPRLLASRGKVTVAVQLVRTNRTDSDVAELKALAGEVVSEAHDIAKYTNIRVKIGAERIDDLAALEDVVNIEPWDAPVMFDERSAQVIAGRLNSSGTEPTGPGYLDWLQSRGLGSSFDFALDVTDSGIDKGSTASNSLHPDFLSESGTSRVVYARDYTSEQDPGDPAGHGTLNVSIAAGGNISSDSSSRDSLNYFYGVGVAPRVRLGSSKIFKSDGRFDFFQPFSQLVADAYRDGARILSNSWGVGSNAYTIDSQEFDLRARDAVPSEPGNQEVVICFAAGNAGPGGRIGAPSTGKNLISVGASESWRPTGTDGCLSGDQDADDVTDVASFSSGGPCNDGRIKPDICAPGTHIQGAASQHPEFDGGGICGSRTSPYFPEGQTLYTWSSGTSHSNPHVSGAAALARQYLLNRSEEPTTALIKAMLVGSATYLSGDNGGGDLPHPRQGWGLLNIGRAFDDVPKIMINQSRTLANTGEEFVITGEVVDPAQPFRITLVWTDSPGFSGAAPWVNDLDLEVVVNGQMFRGNNFTGEQSQPGGSSDSRNNVENVWLPAGTTGPFLLRVRAANLPGDGVPGNSDLTDQDFALVAYNGERGDVPVAMLSGVTVSGGADGIADPGESVSMTVSLKNVSAFTSPAVRVSLTSTTLGVGITGSSADLPAIQAGVTASSGPGLVFSIDRDLACGGEIGLLLQLGTAGTRVPIRIQLGVLRPESAFQDDIESGDSKWTHGSLIKKKKKRIDTWVLSDKRFHSARSSWFTPNMDKVTDSNLDSASITLPSGHKELRLIFYHSFEFESFGFDGGVIEISVDGGPFEDLGPHILIGGYTGSILRTQTNPLAGRMGWIDGRIGLFRQVVVDLDSFAGKRVIIRFRIGTDDSGAGTGWYVDDFEISSQQPVCSPAPGQ